MHKSLLIFTGIIIILVGCDNTIKSKRARFIAKLEGNYASSYGKDSSIYYENWKQVNDTTFKSIGYALKNNDTLFKEEVIIYLGETTKQYIPKVNNQNDGLPVIFTISRLNDSGFIAKNPTHDFPQLINYTIKGNDSLIAYIEGENPEGSTHREYFRMKRK